MGKYILITIIIIVLIIILCKKEYYQPTDIAKLSSSIIRGGSSNVSIPQDILEQRKQLEEEQKKLRLNLSNVDSGVNVSEIKSNIIKEYQRQVMRKEIEKKQRNEYYRQLYEKLRYNLIKIITRVKERIKNIINKGIEKVKLDISGVSILDIIRPIEEFLHKVSQIIYMISRLVESGVIVLSSAVNMLTNMTRSIESFLGTGSRR